MTKYIKGKDGKFKGSIGDGKTNVPTSAPRMPPFGSMPSNPDSSGFGDMESRWRASLEEEQRRECPGYLEYKATANPIPRYSSSEYEVWHRTDLVPDTLFRGIYQNYDPAKTTMLGNKWSAQTIDNTRIVGTINLEPTRDHRLANSETQYFGIPAFHDDRDTMYLAKLTEDPKTGLRKLPEYITLAATPQADGTYAMSAGYLTFDNEGNSHLEPIPMEEFEHRFLHTVGRKANKNTPPVNATFSLTFDRNTGKPFNIEYDTQRQ